MWNNRLRRIESLLDLVDQVRRRRQSLPARPMQTAQDVVDLLQEQIEAIRQEAYAGTLEKARALGYLAGQARKAIETGTLAARLEVLEKELERREGSGS
jgi:hypothetical protein